MNKKCTKWVLIGILVMSLITTPFVVRADNWYDDYSEEEKLDILTTYYLSLMNYNGIYYDPSFNANDITFSDLVSEFIRIRENSTNESVISDYYQAYDNLTNGYNFMSDLKQDIGSWASNKGYSMDTMLNHITNSNGTIRYDKQLVDLFGDFIVDYATNHSLVDYGTAIFNQTATSPMQFVYYKMNNSSSWSNQSIDGVDYPQYIISTALDLVNGKLYIYANGDYGNSYNRYYKYLCFISIDEIPTGTVFSFTNGTENPKISGVTARKNTDTSFHTNGDSTATMHDSYTKLGITVTLDSNTQAVGVYDLGNQLVATNGTIPIGQSGGTYTLTNMYGFDTQSLREGQAIIMQLLSNTNEWLDIIADSNVLANEQMNALMRILLNNTNGTAYNYNSENKYIEYNYFNTYVYDSTTNQTIVNTTNNIQNSTVNVQNVYNEYNTYENKVYNDLENQFNSIDLTSENYVIPNGEDGTVNLVGGMNLYKYIIESTYETMSQSGYSYVLYFALFLMLLGLVI